jgi:hypothetical protein
MGNPCPQLQNSTANINHDRSQVFGPNADDELLLDKPDKRVDCQE